MQSAGGLTMHGFGLDVEEVSKLGGSSGIRGHAVKLPQIVRATSRDESQSFELAA